jgi:hypothetical protein
MKTNIDVKLDKTFTFLGRSIKLLRAKLDKKNAYIGVYHTSSYAYGGKFYSVNILPCLSLQMIVQKLPKETDSYYGTRYDPASQYDLVSNHDPVSPEGWIHDGITWGDQ